MRKTLAALSIAIMASSPVLAAGTLDRQCPSPTAASWDFHHGETLDGILGRWASKAGWTMVYEPSVIYDIKSPGSFGGSMIEAVSGMVGSVRVKPVAVVTFHCTNRVVVLSTAADGATGPRARVEPGSYQPVRAGDTLHDTLGRWATQDGWKLDYRTQVTYDIQYGASFPGTFDVAALELVHAIKAHPQPLIALDAVTRTATVTSVGMAH